MRKACAAGDNFINNYLFKPLGNAIKYQCRMMHKTPDAPIRDAEKAANYSRWLADALVDKIPNVR